MSDRQKKIEELKNKIKDLQSELIGLEEISIDTLFGINFESFLTYIPAGIVFFSYDKEPSFEKIYIASVNPYFEKITGIKSTDSQGKGLLNIINKHDLPDDFIETVIKQNKPVELKTTLQGSQKYFYASFFRNNDKHLVGIFSDYTRLKEAEDTISFERNLFQTLLDKFPDAIYFKDKEAGFIRASLNLTQYFKTTPNEIIGKTDFDFFKKPLAEKKFQDDMNVIKTGIPIINKEELDDTLNEDKRWVLTTKLPLFNKNGEITGMFGISRDITDKKNSEKKETEYKNNLITLTNSALELLKLDSIQEIFKYICNILEKQFKHSLIFFSNIKEDTGNIFETVSDNEDSKNLVKLFNERQMSDILTSDKNILELISKKKIISCNQDLKGCFTDEELKIYFDSLQIKHKYLLIISEEKHIDGIFIILMQNGIRLSDKNFAETFIQQSSLLVQQKKLKELIIIEKDRAEESDKLKTSFLANLSHEIRTPINAIQGFGELLKMEDLPFEKKNEYIGIIQEKSAQLIQIIADIIDISKFESDQVKLSEGEENLNEFLERILSDFEFRISNYIKKEIQLSLIKELENSQSVIRTDFILLKQVITNLLTNSVKFTQKGLIEFGYSIIGNNIQFFLQDTGIGIPEEKRKIVFERFRQVDESRTRKYGGTGLGLAIVNSIIELFNGKIWIEEANYNDFKNKKLSSEVLSDLKNKNQPGAKFIFTIPFAPVKIQPEIKEVEEIDNWRNKTILVVEDDRFNFQFISEVLSINEPIILHSSNGEEAVSTYENEKEKINLILMDLQMPVMDGYEATKIIREMNKEIPIIVQTAYSMPEDIAKAKSFGATDYIVKPYSASALIDKIAKYI